MSASFNPLPFVYVPFGTVDERPAAVVYRTAERCRLDMRATARGISPEASARLDEQWAQLFDAVLLEETARMCAALRGGFAGYPALN